MRANRRCMNGKRIRRSSKAAFKSVSESPLNSVSAPAFKHASNDPLAHPHAKGSYDGYESRFEAIKANKENPEASKEHNTKNATPKAKPLFSSVSNALDTGQDVLTAAGLTPGAGIVPDAINTGVSIVRGGYALVTGDKEGVKKHATNTAVNAASGIPLAGIGVGSVKLAGKALDIAEGAQKASSVVGTVKSNVS